MKPPNIDKKYNLGKKGERLEFLSKYTQYIESLMSCEECDRILEFLYEQLGEEWTTVYSLGTVSVRTGPKMSHGLDFFKKVLPFSQAFHELRNLNGFERLINKLKIPSFEKESTILEVLSAARFQMAGFEIELEPPLKTGRVSDFRVKYFDEWIYFECKKENMSKSKYYERYQKYVNQVMNDITKVHKISIKEGYRIDILFYKRLPQRHLPELYDKIKDHLDNSKYNRWFEMDGLKFAINTRDTYVDEPKLLVHVSQMTVSDKPTKLSYENAHIQIFYNPFGIREIQKIRRIIKEAKNQLPRKSKGVIILEINHTEKMVKLAEEKINQPGYEHIIAILVVGNGAWAVPNPNYQYYPLDFLKIAVLPSN